MFQFLSRNSSRSRLVVFDDHWTPCWQFQFLSRNSSRSRYYTAISDQVPDKVSIPQSEFFSFTRFGHVVLRVGHRCFNSSVGILLVHALATGLGGHAARGFNSSVGILLVHAGLNSRSSRRTAFVSIPQSEFFSFTLPMLCRRQQHLGRFNSSVGILLVHAAGFQQVDDGGLGVSIPQSEFFSFTPCALLLAG